MVNTYIFYHTMLMFLSCHKNRMTRRVIALWCMHVMSLTMSVSAVCFLIEIMLTLAVIKAHFQELYDKQNHTFMVTSYKIYDTRFINFI